MSEITLAPKSFENGRTVMAELPSADSYTGPLIFNPNPKDIAILVPRRWRWLERLLGQQIIILKAGRSLTATSNGKRWRIGGGCR